MIHCDISGRSIESLTSDLGNTLTTSPPTITAQAAEGGAGAHRGERDGARRAAGARQHLGQRAQGPAHPEVTLTATLPSQSSPIATSDIDISLYAENLDSGFKDHCFTTSMLRS